jgi:hypothetical protein
MADCQYHVFLKFLEPSHAHNGLTAVIRLNGHTPCAEGQIAMSLVRGNEISYRWQHCMSLKEVTR